MKDLKSNNFITKDDDWGIRDTVRQIWNKNVSKGFSLSFEKAEMQDLLFDAWFNQRLPKVWIQSRATVLRHSREIEINLQTHGVLEIWIKRNGQLKCGLLSAELYRQIERGEIELPTYLEIEEEKQKWQQAPRYRKEEGFTTPIKEEFVQLRIQKKGG